MQVEKNFNLKSAQVVETQQPSVRMVSDPGIQVTFLDKRTLNDVGALRMEMSPDEALLFAADLVQAARGRLRNGGKFNGDAKS